MYPGGRGEAGWKDDMTGKLKTINILRARLRN
jgi:hypothetical protein